MSARRSRRHPRFDEEWTKCVRGALDPYKLRLWYCWCQWRHGEDVHEFGHGSLRPGQKPHTSFYNLCSRGHRPGPPLRLPTCCAWAQIMMKQVSTHCWQGCGTQICLDCKWRHTDLSRLQAEDYAGQS
eukprot:349634-Chlamydomonas_euryale.AAC.17